MVSESQVNIVCSVSSKPGDFDIGFVSTVRFPQTDKRFIQLIVVQMFSTMKYLSACLSKTFKNWYHSTNLAPLFVDC